MLNARHDLHRQGTDLRLRSFGHPPACGSESTLRKRLMMLVTRFEAATLAFLARERPRFRGADRRTADGHQCAAAGQHHGDGSWAAVRGSLAASCARELNPSLIKMFST